MEESTSCQVFDYESMTIDDVLSWSNADVLTWANSYVCGSLVVFVALRDQKIDGEVLLEMTEQDVRDMRYQFNYMLTLGEIKKLWLAIHTLQQQFKPTSHQRPSLGYTVEGETGKAFMCASAACRYMAFDDDEELMDCCAERVPHEVFKTVVSLLYSFVVTWITSLTMVIVHERVPDMERYPPLPDIFLDNIPRIPWAFCMCEVVGSVLFFMWVCVCFFHKHRLVLLRRFFALAGTVFLLRCVTMLITSLSVPGSHMECTKPSGYVENLNFITGLRIRMRQAYLIWSGLGMSIQGVRTCGDYMFSGHTCALTLLNFFITEYTPRHMYYLHTFTWILNVFGVFFILAAHEHYSIDVFVAFYITSRLFLYYHTLANNHAQVSLDSTRTRIWFPMFYYFEKYVDGVVPNEFDSVQSLWKSFCNGIIHLIEGLIGSIVGLWIWWRQKFYEKFVGLFSGDEDDVGVRVGGIAPSGRGVDMSTSYTRPFRPLARNYGPGFRHRR